MPLTTPARPYDVAALWPELVPLARTAVRLHPRIGDPATDRSSIGGPLWWPVEEPWPTCDRAHSWYDVATVDEAARYRQAMKTAWARTNVTRNDRFTPEERAFLDGLHAPGRNPWGATDPEGPQVMLPIAQLYYRDVPGLPFGNEVDLLQVLWCPFDHEPGQSWPDIRLFWRNSGAFTGTATRPPGTTVAGCKDYVPRPCTITPETITDYPDYDLLPAGLRARIEDWEGDEDANAYRDNAVVPGWKTGGWGAPWGLFEAFDVRCQCGAPAHPLLNIAMAEWDRETVTHWMPVQERHLVDEHDQHRADPDLTIGRGYDLQIFHCATDPAHPPVTIMI
ncbi:hypothetical protein [Glycomyces dulcitolivorans]|uniref:hypothetical protein n=1 Tax=Glycomyces dulcitolivorans TaxID=2200759 RepID=UPI000DD4DA23|nr:hypothetical protein [Glycomyces dulcitolivorans]